MADIREPFELCKIWNSKSLCGIERETKEDNVIITLLDRGILVYNLEHKKLINHWSVEQKDDVTCAAIQNPATREFVVAVNATEILIWKENDSDLKDCQRIQLFQAISGFHVWNSQPSGTLVVFKDGSSSFLGDLLSEQEGCKVKKKRISKNLDKLLWSGIFVHQCHCCLAAIIDRHEDERYSVVISRFESKDRSSERKTVDVELMPPVEDAKLLTCCMHEEGHSITSYWSNGTLCSIELENILQLNTSATPITQLSCKNIHRLQPFHHRKLKRSVALKAIDASHVCLSGTCSIDGESKDVITIWNTKYGTLQSWQTLDKLIEKSSSPDQSYSLGAGHLCCTQSFLCIGFHQFVAACQYSISKCSLASSLGQLDSTARFLADEACKPELLVTPKLVTLHQALHNWSYIVNKQNELERRVLKRLTDPTETPTLETFSSELANYMELRLSEQGDNTRSFRHWRKRISRTADVFSQHFIASVLSRCVNEKSFWPGESISRLLRTKCVPSSSSRELLHYLVERGELELIIECFENIKGIPEDVVVHCLRHVLSLESDSRTKAEGSENMEDAQIKDGEMPVGQTTAKSVCTILRYPVNDVFLQDSLRKLSFREVLLLMRFLVYIMHRGPLSFDKDDWRMDLKYSQVLDWAGLLLNAHYTQLVLMPEAHELLVSCHRTVHKQVRCYDKLRTLEGFLEHYKNHVPLPSVAKTGLYAVEMVEI